MEEITFFRAENREARIETKFVCKQRNIVFCKRIQFSILHSQLKTISIQAHIFSIASSKSALVCAAETNPTS